MTAVFGHGALRLYLLKLLDEQPRHGYELMKELEDRFLGLYTPSAGTIYPRLARLEADGLVRHDSDDAGRKTFTLTDAGRAELRRRSADVGEVEAHVVGSARHIAREVREDVRASVHDLRQELRQATKTARRAERRHAHHETPVTRRELRDLQRELQQFTGDVMSAAAVGGLDRATLSSIVETLRRTRSDIAAALAGGVTPT